jgi:adenosine 3'-phospho 5'-phosphosulfate transporter B3
VWLGAVFFLGMLAMEATMEAAFKLSAGAPSTLAALCTLSQFVACALVPLACLGAPGLGRLPRGAARLGPYARLSALVFGSTGLATLSLGYVPYPVKVVLKSAKLIPVMLIAAAMHRRRFAPAEWLAAALLCGGAVGFALDPAAAAPPGAAPRALSISSHGVGVLLLCVSVCCDALVPNLQQRLLAQDEQLSADQLMANTNAVGAACALAWIVASGGAPGAARALAAQPALLAHLGAIGASLAVAVMAYTRLIEQSGSVVAVTVATLRKVATMACSYLLFPKPFPRQHAWASAAVLGGVVLSTWTKHGRSSASK